MKQWNGKVTVFGEERTYIFDVVADISDELYERAIGCHNRGEELDPDIYEEIEQAIDAKFEIEDYIECDEWMVEKPEKEDYDSDEEYEEALEDFEKEKEEYYDSFYIDHISVEDIGGLLKLKKQFCGKKICRSP